MAPNPVMAAKSGMGTKWGRNVMSSEKQVVMWERVFFFQ
jgi:hypothetical protein